MEGNFRIDPIVLGGMTEEELGERLEFLKLVKDSLEINCPWQVSLWVDCVSVQYDMMASQWMTGLVL